MSIVAATGHRPNKLDNDYCNVTPLVKTIYDEMIAYCEHAAVTEAVSGMALGTDQIWACVALDLNIPLTCIVPFRGQELVWPKFSQKAYHDILSKAAKIIYVHDEPAPPEKWRVYSWLDDRNQYMIDYCQGLIAVYDGSPGGTQNALTYAKKTKPGMPIYIINPNAIRARLAKKPIE